VLCLANGERIKLAATITMLFECNDLSVASPATVSRCGMVFMEEEHVGWEVIQLALDLHAPIFCILHGPI
jgi:dynein heavy chain